MPPWQKMHLMLEQTIYRLEQGFDFKKAMSSPSPW